MSQRKSVSVRPSGTDGSDFSYRMVVDSRYQKVAKGKSRLSAVLFTQAIVQLLSTGILYLSTPKGETLDALLVSAGVTGFISLLIGELGRKWSRSNFLKIYLFGSMISAIVSVASLVKSGKAFELITDLNSLVLLKLEFFKIVAALCGLIVQIYAFVVTTSLIHNMAPPKRAS